MTRANTEQAKFVPWFAKAGAACSIVPIARFIGPSIFALKGGGYGCLFHLSGIDAEGLTDQELESRMGSIEGALRGLPEGSCLYQYTRVMSGYALPRQKAYSNPVTQVFVDDRLGFLEKTASFRRIDLHWCLTLEPPKLKAFERKPQENSADTSRMLVELQKAATILEGHLGGLLGLRPLDKNSTFQWAETRKGWIFLTSKPSERESLRPLHSLWIDLLVLRLLNEPRESQHPVWFVLDELASLQRLLQLHTAITEQRKSKNPLVLGFQGKAQLEFIYGHMAEVMLSQPKTKIFLRITEAAPLPSTNATTTYHRVQVDGVGIFYREAGPEHAPTIVLLHGFPSSSREFDTLIPLLATKYHLIAPDYPGFGLSDAPSPTTYTYTFDHLARTMSDFLEKLKVTHYTLYLHDYGAPIGFRIILAHPDQLHALIIQNGNIYKAGLGAKWSKIAEYWSDPKTHPEVLNAFLSFEGTKERHLAGTSHPDRYDPDTWISEYADLSRPGQREIQGDLLYDYQTNVALYPKWQAWIRDHQPPTLVAWGENDPSFIAPGAEAFRRDLPNANIHLLDAGHFALDEKTDEIADLILQFMAKHPG